MKKYKYKGICMNCHNLSKIILLIPLMFFCGKYDESMKIVARVGNETLSIDDLKNMIPGEYQKVISLDQIKMYIDRWVDTQLIYQEAIRHGLHNTLQDELQRELKKVEIEYLAYKFIEQQIQNNILVSDEEIKTFYDENKESFIRDKDEVRTYHTLGTNEEEIDEILEKVKNGEKFEEICKQRAKVKQSLISNDGDLGFLSQDELPQRLSNEIFKLKINTISKPIKTDFGYHLFKVIDKQSKGSYRTIDEVRDQVVEILKVEKRKERYNAYLTTLRTHALDQKKLTLNIELLKEFSPDTSEIAIK